jgi:hypothetical protein
VEDHKSRFHAAGSSNHGCSESGIRPDIDRQKRANDMAQARAPRFNRLQEIVMANVIEFYIPVRFRKAVKWVPQQQRGRVLEFPVPQKRTA